MCLLELDALKIYFQRAVIFTHCKMHNIGEKLFIEISLVFDGLDFESASEGQNLTGKGKPVQGCSAFHSRLTSLNRENQGVVCSYVYSPGR